MIQAISFGSIKTFRHKKAWTDAPEIIQAAAFIADPQNKTGAARSSWRRLSKNRGNPVQGHSRLASSASSARSRNSSKKSSDWPMKRPMSVKNLTAPMATPCVSVGRMIEHLGSFRLRNGHGSGMIRLVWKVCPSKGAIEVGKRDNPEPNSPTRVATVCAAYTRSDALSFRLAPWRIVSTHTACRPSSTS
jgi:hypothetical protein